MPSWRSKCFEGIPLLSSSPIQLSTAKTKGNTLFVLVLLLLIASLAFFSRISKRWRQQLAYDRAMRDPAIMNATLWWMHELRKATFPSEPNSTPTAAAGRKAIAFRTALMRQFATAFASDPEKLYEDVGTAYDCSALLPAAAAEAGINAAQVFPPTVRMRIRDYKVVISRSGGVFWEDVWSKW